MAAVEVLTCPQARPIPLSPMPCGHDKFNSRASAPEALMMWKENARKGKALFVSRSFFTIGNSTQVTLVKFKLFHFLPYSYLWGIFWLSNESVCINNDNQTNVHFVLIRGHSLLYVLYICYLWFSSSLDWWDTNFADKETKAQASSWQTWCIKGHSRDFKPNLFDVTLSLPYIAFYCYRNKSYYFWIIGTGNHRLPGMHTSKI